MRINERNNQLYYNIRLKSISNFGIKFCIILKWHLVPDMVKIDPLTPDNFKIIYNDHKCNHQSTQGYQHMPREPISDSWSIESNLLYYSLGKLHR